VPLHACIARILLSEAHGRLQGRQQQAFVSHILAYAGQIVKHNVRLSTISHADP
jgi:hypothetical protein